MNPESREAAGPETQDPKVDEGANRRGPLKFAYASGSRPLDGYTIKRGIGAGGFGDVYYATSDAGKDVALKRIQRNLDVELRGVSQCLNLKHPNLVDLYDIRYDDQQQAWVVMEYVSGASLADEIQRNPNGMPLEQVMRWLEGIVGGVAYLHEHGIVHRDLKPGNIFLDHDTVKIGDYGLSKFISCSRRSGQTESVGTFHYMAPEIGLGRYGKEIDIYALGILLFEMLTGRVPFEGESSQEIIMKHLTAQPDLTRVPKGFRAMIARAMAKDPKQRFTSTREVLQAARLQMPGGGAQAKASAQGPPPLNSARVATARAAHQAQQWASQDKEPIAAAVRSYLHRVRDGWRELPSGQRAICAVALLFILLMNLGWLLPIAFMIGLIYCGYYVLWYVLFRVVDGPTAPQDASSSPLARRNGQHGLAHTQAAPQAMADFAQVADAPNAPPSPPAAQQQAPKVKKARFRPRVATRGQVNDALREAMQRKTLAQRGAELTGSMLMAALVACVLSVFMALLNVRDPRVGTLQDWSPLFLWLSINSVAASWIILALSKLWEPTEGDQALRRFFMLVAGMAVGGLAYLLYHALMLDPVYVLMPWDELNRNVDVLAHEAMPSLYSVEGDPHPLAFVGYFGGLFLILRWWLAADPIRTHRFAIWSTLVTIALSMLAYAVIPIPRGFMVVIATIAAVQLASPWIHPRKRRLVKERLSAA